MTDSNSTPPGWYHASGDPENTQRYWDGAQWVGDPQTAVAPVAASPVPTPPSAATMSAPAHSGPSSPSYGAPTAAPYGVAPSGYVPFESDRPMGVAAMTPAPVGKRLGAYFIDAAPIILLVVLIVPVLIWTGEAAAIALVVAAAAFFVYVIWNYWFRRGRTGQSIGDAKMGIKLLKNDTAQPPGAGVAFLRYLVIGLISNFTCGLLGLLDILWPLWDDRNHRLADKMFSVTVVEV